MTHRVFFSRSFSKKDEAEVFKPIEKIFHRQGVQRRFGIETFDASRPTGEQVGEKIKGRISQADVVVGIVTRRHKIENELAYTAPAYVASELAYADALRKRLILIVEKGIQLKELGLVDADNRDCLLFDRSELGTHEFSERLIELLNAQLGAGRHPPVHEILKHEVHLTVWRTGYALTHHKLRVNVIRDEPMVHKFGLLREEGKQRRLPTGDDLIKNGQSECPYPRRPFLAFSTRDPAVRWAEVANQDKLLREYHVHFGETSREYDYQFMWGAKTHTMDRKLLLCRFELAQRNVRSLDLTIRIDNAVVRPNVPVATVVGASTPIHPKGGGLSDEALEPFYQQGTRAAIPMGEQTPLYRCYYVPVEVPRASDVLLIF